MLVPLLPIFGQELFCCVCFYSSNRRTLLSPKQSYLPRVGPGIYHKLFILAFTQISSKSQNWFYLIVVICRLCYHSMALLYKVFHKENAAQRNVVRTSQGVFSGAAVCTL